MEIDYIFPPGIFSSKKSARAKILTEWKTAFKENFPIQTSEILLVFHNRIYSMFNRLVESFNPKNKHFLKGSNKNSKNEY